MTLEIKHSKVSAKANGLDATLVQPSDWNAVHAITLAANSLVGRDGTAGAAMEIACTAFARGLLAAADLTAFLGAAGMGAFTTGDVKLTMKTAADTGWVMCNDLSIGNAASGATGGGAADRQNLFVLLYNNVSDTYAPVSGGRTGNALNDFNANKTLTLTRMLGRALAISGGGAGLTARALGQTLGAETHQLIANEMPVHSHVVNGTTEAAGGHSHLSAGGHNFVTNPGGGGTLTGLTIQGNAPFAVASTDTVAAHTHAFNLTTISAGGGDPHNNMQPTSFLNAMIKL